MNAAFLDRLAGQLKVDRSAACGRAIERILAVVTKNYEGGMYSSETAAELEFRKFVEQQVTCRKPKIASKTIPHKDGWKGSVLSTK